MAEEIPVAPEVAQAVQPNSDEPPRLIRINGEERCGVEYGERGLKHAVAYFLDELMSGAMDELKSPHIIFDKLALKLRRYPEGEEFIAYGEESHAYRPADDMVCDGEVLHSSSRRDDLLHNLRWFVMNDRWKLLIVSFGCGRGALFLRKNGAGYGVWGRGLPRQESAWDWHAS